MDRMPEKSYKNEVQGILTEIQQATISLGNYRRYIEKVKSTEQIIVAQIENNVSEYGEMHAMFKDETNKQSYQDGYDGGIVSVQLFEVVKNMNKKLQDTYSWKALQLELNLALVKKLDAVMGDTQALEIKRDALKEMREDNERRNKLFLDSQKENNDLLKNLMTARHQLMEDKMNLFMGTVSKEIDEKVKLMMTMLTTFAEKVGMNVPPQAKREWKKEFEEQTKKMEEKAQAEEKAKPIEPPKKPEKDDDWSDAQKNIKKESEIKSVDDDDDDDDKNEEDWL